jgi:hypothetical protein
VDYQAPWNPRADGHQKPVGSISRSGVVTASYEWIDVAIRSDTKSSFFSCCDTFGSVEFWLLNGNE